MCAFHLLQTWMSNGFSDHNFHFSETRTHSTAMPRVTVRSLTSLWLLGRCSLQVLSSSLSLRLYFNAFLRASSLTSLVMDGVDSSSSAVGAFASNKHCCGDLCEHPLFKAREEIKSGPARNDRCAAAHALHAAAGLGRKKKCPESDAVLEALIHPSIVEGNPGSEFLDTATGRLFGLSAKKVAGSRRRALAARNGGGNAATRTDAFDKMLVYYYIHGIAKETPRFGNMCIDFCPLVEINKNGYRREWRRKRWHFPWGTMNLKCKPHLRRGSLFEIAESFLNSETYRA